MHTYTQPHNMHTIVSSERCHTQIPCKVGDRKCVYLIVGLESGTRLFNWNVGVDYNTGLEDRPQKYICLPYMYMPETDSSSARKCEGKCTEFP